VRTAQSWDLPEAIVEAIQYIDEYNSAPTASQEVMVTNAARTMATLTLEERSEEEMKEIISSTIAFSELNFYEDDVDTLVSKQAVVLSAIESLKLQ
jgi:HD-like signal output (HDOD) protein